MFCFKLPSLSRIVSHCLVSYRLLSSRLVAVWFHLPTFVLSRLLSYLLFSEPLSTLLFYNLIISSFYHFIFLYHRPLGLTVSQVLVSYASLGLLDKAEEVRRFGFHSKYFSYSKHFCFFSFDTSNALFFTPWSLFLRCSRCLLILLYCHHPHVQLPDSSMSFADFMDSVWNIGNTLFTTSICDFTQNKENVKVRV